MSKIFISYRREETAPYAGRLYDRFVQEFGQDRVFIDVSTIEPGVDFVKAIEEAVAAVDVLVCVMGPEWSTITNNSGYRRLEDPADFVRLEVLSALKRDIRVVPVLVGGANMPSADELPSDLKMLARRNALQLDDARFHNDIDRLIESIRNLLPVTDSGVEFPSEGRRKKAGKAGRWWFAGFATMLLIAGGAWYAGDKYREVVAIDLREKRQKATEKIEAQRKTEIETKREASKIWTIPDTKISFFEKNGHLVSVDIGNPVCPTPPGWRTGCYAGHATEHRRNWRNTPDGYVADGKKVKTFSNRSEHVFEIPGTKHYFYVDDGYLFDHHTATILCPWPKAGAGKCHKIEAQYEDKWRNTPQGFIANGREFDAIDIMRDVRQGLF